jgi:AcrR family transcriptional regulator
MGTESSDSRKKLKRDERREAIISGAAEAFVKNGYEATSLEDVAKSARVSRALLYRHFETKQAIYRAVLDNFLDIFRKTVTRPPKDRWADITLSGLVNVAQIDPNGFRLFYRHAVREPDFRSYYDNLTAKRLAFIDGQLRADIPDSKQRRFKSELVQELVIGTILIWIDNGLPSPNGIPKLISNIISAAIESEEK